MGTAALITGLTLFVPTSPYGEFYVFGKLIDYDDAAKTTQNLLQQPQLFLSGIYAMLFTFLKDVLLAWTMYIFVRPVNALLALLGAWLRIVYAGLSIVALSNLLTAYQLVHMPALQGAFENEQVLLMVNARRFAMNLAFIVFGSYLVLGGVLIYKASYISKLMGVLIILAGLAYILISLQPYFFKEYNLSWMMAFYIGELVFGIWLLVKGSKIKESNIAEYQRLTTTN
ncbi:MAG TPA: DUF4386 domain-containing protein [Flavipsychrobacter sp.]|nr:DUF4386 domain-containing protein [Flavipsychrobacter sp.]